MNGISNNGIPKNLFLNRKSILEQVFATKFSLLRAYFPCGRDV